MISLYFWSISFCHFTEIFNDRMSSRVSKISLYLWSTSIHHLTEKFNDQMSSRVRYPCISGQPIYTINQSSEKFNDHMGLVEPVENRLSQYSTTHVLYFSCDHLYISCFFLRSRSEIQE